MRGRTVAQILAFGFAAALFIVAIGLMAIDRSAFPTIDRTVVAPLIVLAFIIGNLIGRFRLGG